MYYENFIVWEVLINYLVSFLVSFLSEPYRIKVRSKKNLPRYSFIHKLSYFHDKN